MPGPSPPIGSGTRGPPARSRDSRGINGCGLKATGSRGTVLTLYRTFRDGPWTRPIVPSEQRSLVTSGPAVVDWTPWGRRSVGPIPSRPQCRGGCRPDRRAGGARWALLTQAVLAQSFIAGAPWSPRPVRADVGGRARTSVCPVRRPPGASGSQQADQPGDACPASAAGHASCYLRSARAGSGPASAGSLGLPRTRSTEMTIATDATITAPPISTACVIGSSRMSAPRMTATTGFT